MNLWQRLFGASHPPPREEKASAAGTVISAWNVGQPVWTPRDYKQLADETYVRNAIANRCVRMIASSAANIPWSAFTRRKNELPITHPLMRLLMRPNATIGGATLFEAFYSYLLLAGNAYMESVGPETGPPRELWTLRPDRMRIVPGPAGIPEAYEYEANGQKKIWRVDPLTGDGPILHVKEFHPIDDWYGLSRVEAGAYGVDRNNAAAAHNKALLDNGARPSGALIFEPVQIAPGEHQFAPESALDAAKTKLLDTYGGPDNAGKPMVFGGNVKWEEMGISPKDMDFAVGKDDSARDICAAFGVPHILIVPGSATYNNVKEAKLEFYEETVLPLVDRMVDALNIWLVPKFGENLTIGVDLDEVPALEPRRESKRTGVVTLLEKGVTGIDEARAALQYGDRDENFVVKADAAIIAALTTSAGISGYEPLYRYLRSVGLLSPEMTLEQFAANAEALRQAAIDAAQAENGGKEGSSDAKT